MQDGTSDVSLLRGGLSERRASCARYSLTGSQVAALRGSATDGRLRNG